MRRRSAVLIVLATAAVGAGVWWATRPTPGERMAAFVAELRARGEPVTVADLDPPLPPNEENGAADIERGFQWLQARLARADRELEDVSWSLHYVGPWNHSMAEPWHEHATPEQLDELRAFLSTMGPLFEAFAAATAKREIACAPPVDSMADPALWSGSFWMWSRARGLLEARAIVARQASDRLDAMQWLLAYGRRVRVRAHSDSLFAAVFRRIGCLALRDGVEAGRLDPVALRARVDGLLRGGSVATMPRVLRARRVFCIDVFPLLLDGSFEADARGAVRTLERGLDGSGPPSGSEEVTYAVEDALGALRFDASAYLDALREFDALIPADGAWTEADEAALAAFGARAPHALFAGSLVHVLRSADALESLARVALAACEHRRARGVWPRSCADLEPLFPGGVPTNPYSDAPIVLKREGDTLVLRAHHPDDGRSDEELREAGLVWRLPGR